MVTAPMDRWGRSTLMVMVRKSAPPEEVPPKAPTRKSRTSARPAGDAAPHRKSRSSKENRPKPRTDPYAHSRPVKKGKGSFRKKEQS